MRIILVIAALLATAAGAAAVVARHHHAPGTGQLELLARAGTTVTITGHALTGLYPGALNRSLVLAVKNASTFTIKVATVRATVAAKTSVAACAGPANLKVAASTQPLKIARGKSAKATLMVSMPATASDACQGAKFSLKFSAKAVKG